MRPFFSEKFDITKHPRYKYLSDYDKKNAFDVESYLKRHPAVVKPDEPFDLYEMEVLNVTAAGSGTTRPPTQAVFSYKKKFQTKKVRTLLWHFSIPQ